MTSYALHDDSLTIDGRTWPANAFLVAEARAVSPMARSAAIVILCLFAPILAMVWATLVYGPGLWPLRWGGALVLGPGAIALGCWLADRWRKQWVVCVEQQERGYRQLPAADQAEAEATAARINEMIIRPDDAQAA